LSAKCKECSLAECPRVPAVGPADAKVVIVGEAPGEMEARLGLPFVGRSGKLLDQLLDGIGISRQECWITNAVLCHPPDNKTPTAKDIAACRQRLLDEIAAREPKLVIALGKSAITSLVGKAVSIKQVRGRPMECHGVTVLPTYHPAAVLRSPSLYPDLAQDFTLAKELLAGKVVVCRTTGNVSYQIASSVEEVRQMLRNPKTVIDIETASDGSFLCVGVCEGDEVVIVTPDALGGLAIDGLISGHNLKFDMQQCVAFGIGRPQTAYDTMLLHYLHDERPGHHDLESVAIEHLGVRPWKHVMKPYKHRFEDAPREVLYEYNACDAYYTRKLIEPLSALLTDEEKNLYEVLLAPASDALAAMEMRGVRVDVDYLRRLDEQYAAEIEQAKQELFRLAGHEFNPASWQQVAKILYTELRLPLPHGRVSTDVDALEALSGRHQFPGKLLEYRNKQKFLSTTVRGVTSAVDPQGRVHTTFNLHGTVTGRLSSSNPINLQNIPRTEEARNIFVARSGWSLVEGDLSQAEIRVLAMFSQDRALIEALCNSDVHKAVASMMFNVKFEDVTKEQRQAAKHLAFGVIYGMSPKGLAFELGCLEIEAESLIRKFFQAFPAAHEWIRETQRETLRTNKVKTPFGRTRRFELIDEGNKSEVMRQCVNAPIQSTASDITLMALTYLPTELNCATTYPVLTVHDSILLETCDDPVAVAKRLTEHMARPYPFFGDVPMKADAKIGTRWGSLKEV